jgi:hypothetical protein
MIRDAVFLPRLILYSQGRKAVCREELCDRLTTGNVKEESSMKIWFTLTGTNHYLGDDFLEKGMKVRLEKEPDNKVDKEAIQVKMEGLGKIGYVANSPYTVVGESWSAGRLYDKIGDTAKGKVRLVTGRGVLCTLKQKKDDGDPVPSGYRDGNPPDEAVDAQAGE